MAQNFPLSLWRAKFIFILPGAPIRLLGTLSLRFFNRPMFTVRRHDNEAEVGASPGAYYGRKRAILFPNRPPAGAFNGRPAALLDKCGPLLTSPFFFAFLLLGAT